MFLKRNSRQLHRWRAAECGIREPNYNTGKYDRGESMMKFATENFSSRRAEAPPWCSRAWHLNNSASIKGQ
jgi:hypothetical protein